MATIGSILRNILRRNERGIIRHECNVAPRTSSSRDATPVFGPLRKRLLFLEGADHEENHDRRAEDARSGEEVPPGEDCVRDVTRDESPSDGLNERPPRRRDQVELPRDDG